MTSGSNKDNVTLPSAYNHMSQASQTPIRRKYWGSDIADYVVRWLNQTGGTARNRRIVDLLNRLNEYLRFTDKVAGTSPASARLADGDTFVWDGKKMPAGGLLATPNKDIDDARKAINVLLRRYIWRLELKGRYADRSLFAWSLPSKNWLITGDRLPIADVSFNASVVFTEGDAVRQIIELCHEGLIERLRKCTCGTWFYAKFSHSKFCTTACQQKVYRSSPEWKKHRQEWMKRNRALHKQKIFRSTK